MLHWASILNNNSIKGKNGESEKKYSGFDDNHKKHVWKILFVS